MRNALLWRGIIAATVMIFGGMLFYTVGTGGEYYDNNGCYKKITGGKAFGYIENQPAFKEYKEYIIPWKDPLNKALMPYLSIRSVCRANHYNTEMVISGFNFMLDMDEQGNNRYYKFYDKDQIEADPSKNNTGMVFIPGERNAPFAFVVPGGGMTCICAMAEGFPVAKELHDSGYNVFLLQYRVAPCGEKDMMTHIREQQKYANEDFDSALAYIFENAESLEVDKENYSIWGFSAGGQLCQLWGTNTEYGYKAYGLPAPSAAILAYSGWIDGFGEKEYETEPPTFLAYTENDKVIGKESVNSIKEYGQILREHGTAEEFVSRKAPHGFGTGEGTDAEGWMEKAVAFWRECH